MLIFLNFSLGLDFRNIRHTKTNKPTNPKQQKNNSLKKLTLNYLQHKIGDKLMM